MEATMMRVWHGGYNAGWYKTSHLKFKTEKVV